MEVLLIFIYLKYSAIEIDKKSVISTKSTSITKEIESSKSVERHSNYFSFSQWKSCLSLLFTVDAVIMISIGVCLYIIMNNAIMMNNQISANLASFASINSQLSSSTLTTEQRASLLAQQTELMRILFSDVSEMNNNFKVVYSFDLIFILYFVRSLFHIIHSKITDKGRWCI